MPFTIFGKAIGGTVSAKSNPGQKNAPGGTTRSGRLVSPPAGQSKVSGRQGSIGPAASNAGSQVYAFNQTLNPGNTFTCPLTLDGDFIAMNFNITAGITASSASTDILRSDSLVLTGPAL